MDELEGRRFGDLARLTEAVRRVIEATATTGVDAVDLALAAEGAEVIADRLEARQDADPWATRTGARTVDLSDPAGFLPLNPVIGRLNPIAPPVELEVVDREVRGRARLGTAYVGPPGRVHGGWVAAILDQVLGLASVAAGHPGMTASLTVHMRRATPLHSDLTVEARQLSVDGRRSTVWGAIFADGVLTAEAEGVFVLPRQPHVGGAGVESGSGSSRAVN
ncbi:PaaI family thioesterase [Acidimicrobiia bacterium EGI L10123]|uniref:PaaI family thioesterase n=1 Tax=Salinilacustrithrix flava TaxID=2957203 RepID=UPI003D7C2C3F|nr:PaaI family thioesterase [Acidimicrobiia bacterium EGI L10123]